MVVVLSVGLIWTVWVKFAWQLPQRESVTFQVPGWD